MKKLILLAITPLAAMSCPDLSIGVEALYWKPCHDPFRYGLFGSGSGGTESPANYLDFIPDATWGVRVFGSISDGCNFASLEWAHINDSSSVTKQNNRTNFTLVQLLYGNNLSEAVETLTASERDRYNKISLRIGHKFCQSRCAALFAYGGGRWVDIEVKNASRGIRAAGGHPLILDQSSSFNSGGIELGVEGVVDIWCGIGASFRLGGMALIGERSTFLFHSQQDGMVVLNQRSSATICLSGVEARVGLDYTYNCGCFWVRGQIGYEIDAYFSALGFHLPDAAAANLISSNFSIGGLFFGLTVGY